MKDFRFNSKSQQHSQEGIQPVSLREVALCCPTSSPVPGPVLGHHAHTHPAGCHFCNFDGNWSCGHPMPKEHSRNPRKNASGLSCHRQTLCLRFCMLQTTFGDQIQNTAQLGLPDIWTGKGGHGQLERRTNGGKGGQTDSFTFLASTTKFSAVKNCQKKVLRPTCI